MNRSGRAAAALCRHHEALAAQFVVVYDDADLELGRIRIRPLGGSGGHNGVRSMIDSRASGVPISASPVLRSFARSTSW